MAKRKKELDTATKERLRELFMDGKTLVKLLIVSTSIAYSKNGAYISSISAD